MRLTTAGPFSFVVAANVAFGYFINTLDQDVEPEFDYDPLQLDLNFVY